MKKFWEINAVTIEDSIKIALKQIQKYVDKRRLVPTALTLWEERGHSELAVAISFEPGEPVNMADWINSERKLDG
jgi:hypothetical protein